MNNPAKFPLCPIDLKLVLKGYSLQINSDNDISGDLPNLEGEYDFEMIRLRFTEGKTLS